MGQHPAARRARALRGSQTAADRKSGAEPRRRTRALLLAYVAVQLALVALALLATAAGWK